MPHRWDSKSIWERLRYLNIVQLRDLLEDEEAIRCTIRGSKKLQDLHKQSEVKWASNRMLAEQNLSYQPYLKTHKLLLAERYQLLGQLVSSLRHKQKKLDKLHGRLSLKAMQQFLKQKVANLMDESERFWEMFLEDNLLLVDFIELFHSTQKFYYKHLAQVEKIQDLSTQIHEQWHMEMLSTAGTQASNLQTQNVLYSLSPVVMLPGTLPSLMEHSLKTSYHLPPLNHHGSPNVWTSFIPINSPNQPKVRIFWPQKRRHLRQYKETKDHGPKPSQ